MENAILSSSRIQHEWWAREWSSGSGLAGAGDNTWRLVRVGGGGESLEVCRSLLAIVTANGRWRVGSYCLSKLQKIWPKNGKPPIGTSGTGIDNIQFAKELLRCVLVIDWGAGLFCTLPFIEIILRTLKIAASEAPPTVIDLKTVVSLSR